MFKNYLKFTFRNLYVNKIYTMIKIAGLALALAVSMAICLWVRHETGYDRFHKDADRIYRLQMDREIVTMPAGFKVLSENIPEIESLVRLFNANFLGERIKVSHVDKIHTNDAIYYTDDNFFDIFSFPLIQGDPATVFTKPNAAIITRETAAKYFGSEDPIGQTLVLGDNEEIEITGVLENIPSASHFHFDILITIKCHPWLAKAKGFESGWIFSTYIKINDRVAIESVARKLNQALASLPKDPEFRVSGQPLRDIHLHSHYYGELEPNGDAKYVYLFSAIGLLIILIASINYVNLTTALATHRAKEIGIRKAIGAEKRQLIFQIMGESVLISIMAFALALIFLEMMRPLFTSFLGIAFFSRITDQPFILIMGLVFTVVIGAFTGLFPAIALSGNDIIDSIKPGYAAMDSKKRARGVLVIFQFCISIILMVGTLVIFQQMQFIQHKNLGYDKDHVLVLHTGYESIAQKREVLENLIASSSDVLDITSASQLPTHIITSEGINTPDGQRYEAHYISVDKNFFTAMGMTVLKGHEQIAEMMPQENTDWTNIENKFVVNQALLDEIGVKLEDTERSPLIIRHGNMKPGPIIGVVKDFHFESLHTPITPLVFEFTPGNKEFMFIRINSNNMAKTVGFIEQQWNQVAAGLPFEYQFIDEQYNALYQLETQTGRLFIVFTAISVFIIVLGLLGLISFMAARKTKEIGIRKVLGASVEDVLYLLSKTFVFWVGLANLIAWPVAWFAMHKWLENFAYRIDLTIWPFLLSGLLALLIALLTVSWQAIRAATANPIKALKYE